MSEREYKMPQFRTSDSDPVYENERERFFLFLEIQSVLIFHFEPRTLPVQYTEYVMSANLADG